MADMTGDTSTSALAITPLTIAAPVGTPFLLRRANTLGMFFLSAACAAT